MVILTCSFEIKKYIFVLETKKKHSNELTSKYEMVEKSSGHECSRTGSVFSSFAFGNSFLPKNLTINELVFKVFGWMNFGRSFSRRSNFA